ncbi:MAG TPA: large-conductance mechanosensitive channel protein MscL [Alphaproteobacteria bacterium]
MLSEFRAFALRGNAIDMAVGIIIGAAFGRIVSSLVNDVIMPPVGLLLGGVDFTNLFVTLSAGSYPTLTEAQAAGAATINVGVFINAVIDFVIVAFAIFLVVRQMNRLKRQPPPAEPTEKDCPFCLARIPIKATRCGHCTSELARA